MKELSNKVIHRLTLYHCILKYTVCQQEYISSFEIADLLKLDDSQVRKDIALCGVLGRQNFGYPTAELKKKIEEKLGFTDKKEVFVIGAGNLGSALANYSDFQDYGIDIIALFDNNPAKVGQVINNKTVFSLEKLENLISEMDIKNIILAVPPQHAQSIIDYVVQCGIKFIWNFTPAVLKVPEHVTVYYENIVSSFLQMRNSSY